MGEKKVESQRSASPIAFTKAITRMFQGIWYLWFFTISILFCKSMSDFISQSFIHFPFNSTDLYLQLFWSSHFTLKSRELIFLNMQDGYQGTALSTGILYLVLVICTSPLCIICLKGNKSLQKNFEVLNSELYYKNVSTLLFILSSITELSPW